MIVASTEGGPSCPLARQRADVLTDRWTVNWQRWVLRFPSGDTGELIWSRSKAACPDAFMQSLCRVKMQFRTVLDVKVVDVEKRRSPSKHYVSSLPVCLSVCLSACLPRPRPCPLTPTSSRWAVWCCVSGLFAATAWHLNVAFSPPV